LDSESQLIERIAKAVPSLRGAIARVSSGLRLGIGDDAAVGAPRPGHEWVVSCDQFVEGVHFLAPSYPADSVGYKALVRAASDLAAMGARPSWFLLTLALPRELTGAWLDDFLGGMGRAAREIGMRLAGGDTTRGDKVAISITVVGEVRRGQAVTRSGARPGDVVCVSGVLGRAALGLALMEARGRATASRAGLLQPHLYPKIRLELGAWLAKHRVASAMMDISDGLSTDLARLCEASGVGARLAEARIPCVKIPASAARLSGGQLDRLKLALHGGEDYELLFTVPRGKLRKLHRAPGFSAIRAIGEITRRKGIVLVDRDGQERRLKPAGWDPFERR
jgi:thiamine-monophosphate kinase